MASSTQTMVPSMSGRVVAGSRPYKDFMTPALHRRFVNAASICLAACWVEAILMSKPDFFWSWFPLGFTGIRTLLLFTSCLMVYILRIAQLSTHPRMAASALLSFWQCATSRRALHTLLWYTLSAFLFCETYMSSTARDTNLGLVDVRRSYERPRLNERPVLIRTLFCFLAFVQTCTHLYRDLSCIRMARSTSMIKSLRAAACPALQRSLSTTIIATLAGLFVYFAFFRDLAWTLAYAVGSLFYSLAKSNGPSGITDFIALMARYAYSALLLSLLWEITNTTFTLFAAKEPLRSMRPLTSESRDPNGSLINGLRSKKVFVKAMAFCELSVITERFNGRRQSIFQDVDRNGGSAWSQTYELCCNELHTINTSINDTIQPKQPVAAPQIQHLPKLTQPMRQDNVVNASPRPASAVDAFTNSAGSLAKSLGQSHETTPRSQRMIEYGSGKVLGDPQAFSGVSVSKQVNKRVLSLLQSPIGGLFRHEFSRLVNMVVFVSPPDLIYNAVQSICGLVICSLTEDTMGQVQNNVAELIRLLVRTIQNLDMLVQRMSPHWTDVYCTRKATEVSQLSHMLKEQLAKILMGFGEYADHIGLTKAEHRLAREVANVKPGTEMIRS